MDPSIADTAKVQIRLSTREDGLEVPDDSRLLFAPTSLRRVDLSRLVNNLLHNDTPIPFEFLVNGQFLRTSIDEFLTQNGISAETTLNVEYTRAFIPSLHVSTFEHDDWVSAVDILSTSSPAGHWTGNYPQENTRILSASYDGLLRVWDTAGNVLATSSAPHNGGRITSLKSAKWLSDKKIAAAGMDGVVRVYSYDDSTRTLGDATLELYNHNWQVDNIAVHGPSHRILAASADTTISLFSSRAKENPAAPESLLPRSTAASNKRQKLSKPAHSAPARGALATLRSHTAPVSAVLFAPNDPTVAYSASLDHSLKTWDLPTSSVVETRATSHALLSMAALPTLNLVATGTSARHISLIDPRASATHIAVMTLRGHANAVVSLDTHPRSEYGLVSGSHDGTVRVWDVRSVRTATEGQGQVGESVFVIEREGVEKMRSHGEGVKVFDVRWEEETGIVSAGEDKKVQINRH